MPELPVRERGAYEENRAVQQYQQKPYFEGAEKSTMQALSDWVVDSDKVITF